MPKSVKMSKGTAMVTGGAIRLGKVLSITLANMGYRIAIHYNKSSKQADLLKTELEQSGVECDVFQFDFNQSRDASKLIGAVYTRFPDFNVLVNSASVYAQANMMETTADMLEEQFKVNFMGPYFLTKAFAQQCNKGNVVNILDNKIAFNQYQYSAYLLSKKSLAELTKLAALELAPDIRVNGLAPGVVMPADERTNDYIDWRIKGIPVKKQGTTENVSDALQYILSNDFVCGQILTVDGGESLTHVGQNTANYE